MKKEMEEADRRIVLSIEKGARPNVYNELRHRTETKAQGAEIDDYHKHEMEGQIVAKRENELYKRRDKEMDLLQEGNSLKR